MSNLVTEVDRAIQFEVITKQAHEANLQALKDGKIIGVDDFLKLVEVEPKLRWMNDNLRKWATGSSLSVNKIISLNEYGTDKDNLNKHVIRSSPAYAFFIKIDLPKLPFNFSYLYATGKIDYTRFYVAIDKKKNDTHSVSITGGIAGTLLTGKDGKSRGEKAFSLSARGIKDYTSFIYIPLIYTNYGAPGSKIEDVKWVSYE